MNYFKAYIPAFKIILTALVAFSCYRICFLVYNSESIPDHPQHPFYLYYRSLLYGINFDLVIICYILSPFVIFCFLQQLFSSGNPKGILKGYTFFKWYFIILFSICLFICAADIPYYRQFATHLNKDALTWGSSPGFVLRLIFSSFS